MLEASVKTDTTTIKLTDKLSKRQENISTNRRTFCRYDSLTLRVLFFFAHRKNILKFSQPTLAHLALPLPTSRHTGKTNGANSAITPVVE
jgi:cysteinyl-tRNA synthetase